MIQIFESINPKILMFEMNQFANGDLDRTEFDIVAMGISGYKGYVHYRSRHSMQEVQRIALERQIEEKLKKEAEQNKQYTDEELKKIAEDNAKTEKPVDSFYDGMKKIADEDPEFKKQLLELDRKQDESRS